MGELYGGEDRGFNGILSLADWLQLVFDSRKKEGCHRHPSLESAKREIA